MRWITVRSTRPTADQVAARERGRRQASRWRRHLLPRPCHTEDLSRRVRDASQAFPTRRRKPSASRAAPRRKPTPPRKPRWPRRRPPRPPRTGSSPGRRSRSSRAQLPPKYREFLELVDLIITDQEKEVFLQIADVYQKDRFIENFWRRRSIDSQGLRTDYQAVHTRRVEMAKEQFRNHLNSDRAKMLIINGPPDAVVPIDCQEVYVPIQIWYYDRSGGPEEQGLPDLLRALRRRRIQALAAARRRRASSRSAAESGPARRRGRPAAGGSTSTAAWRPARSARPWPTPPRSLGSGAIGPGRRGQAVPAADRRERGDRPDPDDDDGARAQFRAARRGEARPVSGDAREQDRRRPLAARLQERPQGPRPRRGEVLQRRRHRRGRQGRAPDRQLQVPLRHPDSGSRRREDPADRPPLPLPRRLQPRPQGLRRQPERRGPDHRQARRSRSSPTLRPRRSRRPAPRGARPSRRRATSGCCLRRSRSFRSPRRSPRDCSASRRAPRKPSRPWTST